MGVGVHAVLLVSFDDAFASAAADEFSTAAAIAGQAQAKAHGENPPPPELRPSFDRHGLINRHRPSL